MNINKRVKEIRQQQQLTLKQFGERIGVTNAAISRIENGNRAVTEQMIKLICSEFNINEAWLRTGEGDMSPKADSDVEYGRICAELGVSDERAKKIIMNYANFSTKDKELFWGYVDALMKE